MAIATDTAWTTEDVRVGALTLRLRKGGAGDPMLVLSHDIGSLERLPLYDALARRFTVYVPSHPGYDGSERRTDAQLRTSRLSITAPRVDRRKQCVPVGLGFAAGSPPRWRPCRPRPSPTRPGGAMGVKPVHGEIFDQAIVSYIDYVRAGFADQSVFDRLFGADPPTERLEQWDLNREMTFRIAWKPYMYSPTLPHLLGGVRTPALIVWGRGDKVVPLECGEAYARALPRSRLAVVEGRGHFVDMEQPEALAKLIMGSPPSREEGRARRGRH